MSTHTIVMTPKLYHYYQSVGYREPKALQALRQETMQMPGAEMQISPEQGQFMQLLIELMQAKKTLDIGTFTGYSALAVALALPSNGKVIACDISAETAEVAKRYWREAEVSEKIEFRLGQAVETLQSLLDQGEADTFDFAFIDADKNNYPQYYEYCLKLLRSGGLIAIDNVLWGGKVADVSYKDKQTQTLRELNQLIVNDERVIVSMVPIGDGLTLARKQ